MSIARALNRSFATRALTLAACAFGCATRSHAQSLDEHAPREGSWATLCGDPHRSSTSPHPLPDITQPPLWTRNTTPNGLTINWLAQASPLASREQVLALGILTQPSIHLRLFACSRHDGALLWSTPLPASLAALGLESQSVPTLDTHTASVLVASGSTLSCLDLTTGVVRWQRGLGRLVVNASPVISRDVPGRGRAFLTLFDAASGTGGELLSINLDPRDNASNPFDLGAIVWRTPIGGSSGNSPAFLSASMGGMGLVYVTTAGAYGQFPTVPGEVRAYVADADTPTLVWSMPNPSGHGFYGGLAIRASTRERPTLACASYAFFGGLQSANTIVLDAGTGTLLASIPSNRSSSVPMFLPSGNLLLSGGLSSASVADTAPGLELLLPTGRLWHSALSTWTDTNANWLIDAGEYLSLGHYIHHPAMSTFAGSVRVLVGTAPQGDALLAPDTLFMIDPSVLPTDASFVRASSIAGFGASPSLAGPNAYVTGAAGLAAFGPSPRTFDVDVSGAVSLADLHAREAQGLGVERSALLTLLRASEREGLLRAGTPRRAAQ